MNHEDTTKLADKVKAFWAARGHKVKTEVVRTRSDNETFYDIKSDMIDGLPRSLKRKGAA